MGIRVNRYTWNFVQFFFNIKLSTKYDATEFIIMNQIEIIMTNLTEKSFGGT